LSEWTIILTTIFALYLILQISYIYVSIKLKQIPSISAIEQKISVLIPSYNEELVLLQCLEGWRVQAQKKEPYLLMMVLRIKQWTY
jgi:cellulose synthase/poly-beta-1,6-N-acetylglucosamine synthase-like glycosyltransferase